ncbi:HAMP domain-containing sensor histidine kinase [Bifidobacterium lemurum]|nr:HAMP domain-containing sensor histidine kinase [Bifidobacterium lemurum]QOL35451.1 HAMP domain-containing histidine kinase [Bifidobacterium lemurum]
MLVGISVITLSIRTLVGSYVLERTDRQLVQQRDLVFRNIDLLSQSSSGTSGLNSYFLQIQYTDGTVDDNGNAKTVIALLPRLKDDIVSMPSLPANGDTSGITLGEPFTTSAIVQRIVFPGTDEDESDGETDGTGSSNLLTSALGSVDRSTLNAARAPWRVLAMQWVENNQVRGIVYIGLSLSDQIDTMNTLTRYCVIVGIAVMLLGGSIATLVMQRTMAPLKRIEKTAAKIAAGDLSQRVPEAPENTEVGSLSASLNTMLTRIESSFREQEETTAKMKRFVSDASHELRTPLAAIHGYAELYTMQRDLPGALERADESISHIEKSSARMTVLVEDLLSLARLDEGRGIDVTGTVNLTSVVGDATDDLHALDPERGISLGTLRLDTTGASGEPGASGATPSAAPGARLVFTEDAPPQVMVPGDASRLRQVVTNIVGNIHRYTPADSPAEAGVGVIAAAIDPIQLSRLPSDDQSLRRFIEAAEVADSMPVGYRYAVIRFSDHGPGVPEESRAQIFERFYTADPSRARDKGGTGLGLAIAQSVVKAHRGFICATATPGGGLTFTVVLPIEQVPPSAAVTSAAAASVRPKRRRGAGQEM